MTEGKIKDVPNTALHRAGTQEKWLHSFIPHFIALSLSTSVLLTVTEMLVLFYKKKKGSAVEEEGLRRRFENQRAGPIFHLKVKETGDSKVVSKVPREWRTGLRQAPLCNPQLSIYTPSPIYLLGKPSFHSLRLDQKTATSKEILFSNI